MAKPTSVPDWATGTNYGFGPYPGQPNKATPPGSNITEGFDPQNGIPAEWVNWLFNNHGQWINWHDRRLDGKERYFVQNEVWPAYVLSGSSTGPLSNYPHWTAKSSVGSFTIARWGTGLGTVHAPTLGILAGGNGGDNIYVYQSAPVVAPGFAAAVSTVSWDIAVTKLVDHDWYVGGYNGRDTVANYNSDGAVYTNSAGSMANVGVYFKIPDGASKIQMITDDGSFSPVAHNSSVTPAINTLYRLSLVYDSGNTTCSFYINGNLEGTFSISIAALALGFSAGARRTNTSSAGQLYIGPVSIVYSY